MVHIFLSGRSFIHGLVSLSHGLVHSHLGFGCRDGQELRLVEQEVEPSCPHCTSLCRPTQNSHNTLQATTTRFQYSRSVTRLYHSPPPDSCISEPRRTVILQCAPSVQRSSSPQTSCTDPSLPQSVLALAASELHSLYRTGDVFLTLPSCGHRRRTTMAHRHDAISCHSHPSPWKCISQSRTSQCSNCTTILRHHNRHP